MPSAIQQSSSHVNLEIFQEVSYHCYIIQPLSLTQERMALKLISAWLQLVLLHPQRSRIVIYLYCKRRKQQKASCWKICKSPSWSVCFLSTGFNPASLQSTDTPWGQTYRSALIFYRPQSASTSIGCSISPSDAIQLWPPETFNKQTPSAAVQGRQKSQRVHETRRRYQNAAIDLHS